jgi:Glycine-rich domain
MSKASTQTFLSNATWTAPAGVTSVTLYGIGGGGGGGGAGRPPHTTSTTTRGGGGGGGGGAVASYNIVSVVPGSSYTITIGAGGTTAAGATSDNGNGTNGNDGADTTFGSLATFCGAGGGGAGAGSATVISTGGSTVRGGVNPVSGYATNLGTIPYIGWAIPGYGAIGGNNALNVTAGYLATAAQGAVGNPNGAAAPSPSFGPDSTGVGGYAGGGGGTSVYAAGGAAGTGGSGSATTGNTGNPGGNATVNTGAGGGGGGGGGNGATASANAGNGGSGGSGQLTVMWID